MADLQAHPNISQPKIIPMDNNRNIDILFIIDDSVSMGGEQTSLGNNFPAFMGVLRNIMPGGLPNVHIGVVSSDVGTQPYNSGNCVGEGDDGFLQDTPQGTCTSWPAAEPYIIDLNQGGTTNYSPMTLEQAFTCIALLGQNGCGFEQHLESMKRALARNEAGFIRPNAYLGLVFIADEDDCSQKNQPSPGTPIFSEPMATADSTLGLFNSFRCFEFGVECCPAADPNCTDPNPASRNPADYASCRPRQDAGAYLGDVDSYVNFVKGLKNPALIIAAGIIGLPTNPVYTYFDGTKIRLGAACGMHGQEIAADPGIRLKYFIDQFAPRSIVTPICNADLTSALTVIAQLMKEAIGDPCFTGNIDTTDINPNMPGIQLQCTVSDVQFPGEPTQTQQVIPRCPMINDTTPDLSSTPCWWAEVDAARCPDDTLQPTHMILNVERGGAMALPGTSVVAECVVPE